MVRFSKKLTKLLAVLCLMLFACGFCVCFSACKTQDDGKIHVVCTVFPQYDWARAIAKGSNNMDIDLIVKNGSDLHSYFSTSPNFSDTYKIKNCDILIFCGGESEEAVETLLSAGGVNKNMVVINLLDILKDENMAILEDGEEDEFDEHVWLSLVNAKLFVSKISEVFSEVNAQEANLFQQNATNYNQKLEGLKQEYDSLSTSANQKASTQGKTASLLVADRFPFAYLVRDMNLNHMAAFSGCSAETSASLKLTTDLANFANEQGLDTILILEGGNYDLANSVKNTSTQNIENILELNSIQGVRQADIDAGASFFAIMNANLNVLKTALAYLG